MRIGTHALAALLVAAAACAQVADEPEPSVEELASAPVAQAALVQANAEKPLIHVWKSPT
jgi:predicted short-subunit dehydrogenase-like oxidoreductase (DUF2520 family)